MTDFNITAPGIRITTCALFFNEKLEILVVKPIYRIDEDWLIGAGGKVEPNESPRQACKREVCEELGVNFPIQQLLCVEYQSPWGAQDESYHFTFYGGVLSTSQIQQIKLPADELVEFRFHEFNNAMKLLSPRLGKRLSFALEALKQVRIIYFEALAEIGNQASINSSSPAALLTPVTDGPFLSVTKQLFGTEHVQRRNKESYVQD